jgi:lactoylglutathione lyase
MKLNHILVLTSDLDAMAHFWTKLIGLRIGERPPFPFDGLWLYSEDKPLVHVAEQPRAVFGLGSVAHVALQGADYKAMLARLKQNNHPYTEKDVPLSGERQVFISGPDGLIVEMMFPLNPEQARDADFQRQSYESDDNFNFLGGKIS